MPWLRVRAARRPRVEVAGDSRRSGGEAEKEGSSASACNRSGTMGRLYRSARAPLLLADRAIVDAVACHHEQQDRSRGSLRRSGRPSRGPAAARARKTHREIGGGPTASASWRLRAKARASRGVAQEVMVHVPGPTPKTAREHSPGVRRSAPGAPRIASATPRPAAVGGAASRRRRRPCRRAGSRGRGRAGRGREVGVPGLAGAGPEVAVPEEGPGGGVVDEGLAGRLPDRVDTCDAIASPIR